MANHKTDLEVFLETDTPGTQQLTLSEMICIICSFLKAQVVCLY